MRAGDGRLRQLAQRPLGPLGGGCRVGQRLRIGARIGAVLLLELLGDVIDDAIVPVLAAQAHVALDGQRLEALLRQADQRHVEGAAAEVVDEDGAVPAASGPARPARRGVRRAGSE